jgi:hypothetical protein
MKISRQMELEVALPKNLKVYAREESYGMFSKKGSNAVRNILTEAFQNKEAWTDTMSWVSVQLSKIQNKFPEATDTAVRDACAAEVSRLQEIILQCITVNAVFKHQDLWPEDAK